MTGMAALDTPKIQLNCYKQLAEGCRRHPAYRAKKKPTVKCQQCEVLWDLAQKLRQFEEINKRWWRATLNAESKRQREEAEARERYYNTPG